MRARRCGVRVANVSDLSRTAGASAASREGRANRRAPPVPSAQAGSPPSGSFPHTLPAMHRSFLSTVRAALVLSVGWAGAATAQPVDFEARLDRLSKRLELTPEQRSAAGTLAADAETPAGLWAVTADLHARLTAEQRAALTEARAEHRARGERPRDERRLRGERAPRPGAERSDAQREARRAERERLREQRDSGALSADAYAAAVRALREQRRAEALAAATPEQRARLEARAAQRQAEKAARERVLGLTEAQAQQLQALRHDRAARRADRGERAELLTERQRELLALHRALAGHGGRGHRRGGPRG